MMMKSMLILTDFSEHAFRAAEYACTWTGPLQIKRIVLFHAYQSYIGGAELPVVLDSQQIYLDSLQELGLLHDRMKSMVDPSITIDFMVEDTVLSDRINALCKEQSIDLLVMGMSGKSGFEKLLIGSTADQMIRTIQFPLLIVYNEAMIGKRMDKIVLPLDRKAFPHVQANFLAHVLDAFRADLHLLYVRSENDQTSISYPDSFPSVQHLLDPYEPTFHLTDGDDIATHIMEFSAIQHASLIILVHRKYDFLPKLFHKSISQNLAHHAHTPLLLLPDLV
jgi:nucleotide-binding universal stress UspA family protein